MLATSLRCLTVTLALLALVLPACGGSPTPSDFSAQDSRSATDTASARSSGRSVPFAYFGDSISRVDCCTLLPEQGYLARFVSQASTPLSHSNVVPTVADTINFAVNGSTLQETYVRLQDVLSARDVAVVHVMSGMNQFLRLSAQRSPAQLIADYRVTLEQVVDLVHGQGRSLVWSLTTPISQAFGHDPYQFHARCEVEGHCTTPQELSTVAKSVIDGINQAIVETGAARGFLVLDTVSPLMDAQGYLRPEYVIHSGDPIHPNPAAHAVMAQVLLAHEAQILAPAH